VRTSHLLAPAFGLAACLATGAARAEKTPLAFPAGSEAPLAALQDIDVIERLGDRVPTKLTFTDSTGAKVSLDDLVAQNKPVLVTLGYHRCPMLCSLVLDGLVKALKESKLVLGKDLLAVDVSIDPTEDLALTTGTQKRVAQQAGVAPAQWPFWLSTADGGAAARALADAVGFKYKYDEQSKQYAHEAVAFLIAPGASWRDTSTASITWRATSASRSSSRATAASARSSIR